MSTRRAACSQLLSPILCRLAGSFGPTQFQSDAGTVRRPFPYVAPALLYPIVKETLMTSARDCAYFMSGLGAGLAIALLFAPRSGSAVRNEIRHTLQRGGQAIRDGKTVAAAALEREKEGLGAAIDAGKRAYQETTGRGRREAEPSAAS